MKLVQGCFGVRKDRERNFHDSGSAVKFVQTCLSVRKHRESSFHHCMCWVIRAGLVKSRDGSTKPF